MKIPDDLVLVGHIAGAYGLQGWVKIQPYSAEADALLHAKTWWLDKPAMRDVERMQVREHGGGIVAQLMGVADRDAAEALKGTAVRISRSHFPALADNEFYWVDLIGMAVENLQGTSLGTVGDLMDNGAHPILRVQPAAPETDGKAPETAGKAPEMLIPFVEQYVIAVDREARKVTVDWELDY